MFSLKGHLCPECKAKEGEPCRTPKGRKKKGWHNTRPFSVELAEETANKITDAGTSPFLRRKTEPSKE